MARLAGLLAAYSACAAGAELQDIRGPMQPDSLPPFTLTVGVLLAAGALLLLLGRRRAPAEPPSCTAPAERDPLAVLAEEYRCGVCPGERVIVRLDALVRDALATRAGVPARHLTSWELGRRLGTEWAAGTALARLLALGDRTKFAGHRPDALEVEAALQDASVVLKAIATG